MTAAWARPPSHETLERLRVLYVESVGCKRDPDRIVMLLVQTPDGHALPEAPIMPVDEFIALFLGHHERTLERVAGPPPLDKVWLAVLERESMRLALGWIDVPVLSADLFPVLRARELRDPLPPPARQLIRDALTKHLAEGGEKDCVIVIAELEDGIHLDPRTAFVPRERFVAERWIADNRLHGRIAAGARPGTIWVTKVTKPDSVHIWQMLLSEEA